MKLSSDELSRGRGANVGIEEGVNVCRGDVHGGAERGRVLLQDVDGLGGCDGPAVTGGFERGSRAGEEADKRAGRAVAVEDSLVADDYHLNVLVVAVRPGSDLANLRFCAGDARLGDEDAQDKSQAVGCGGGANFLQTGAVGAV